MIWCSGVDLESRFVVYEVKLSESYFAAQDNLSVLDLTVGDALRAASHDYPDAVAIMEIDEGGDVFQTITNGRIFNDSLAWARGLSTRFDKGERVVVWAPNMVEWLMLEYACALAGIVLVTANPAFQAPELRYVIEQSGAVGLFLVESHRGNPMAQLAAEATLGLDLREINFLDDHDAIADVSAGPAILAKVEPADPLQIQYTSGTTGFPKGAVIHHKGLFNNGRFVADRARVSHDSVIANFMPLFHTAGCGMNGMAALANASTQVLFRGFNADHVCKAIEQHRITTFFAVPTMLVALLESLQHTPRDMSSMELITSGGAPVAPDLVHAVREVMGCEFATAFGQTEHSPVICQNWPDGEPDDISFSAGQPLPHTEVSIRNKETNTVVPVGDVGEICARGYAVMLGYHDKPEETAATVDANGWLHTGDLGTMDSRGFLRVTGRIKDMIIRGGENLFPVEIENAMLESSDVAEIAVVGLPDDRWGEIVAAFIRTSDGLPLSKTAMRAHCRNALSPQKTPTKWYQVEEFPLTGSGKIQKFALREMWEAGAFDA